jgi:hypothetical protein
VPIVELFRMATGDPHQPSHRLLSPLHESGRSSHATAFPQMAEDILGFRLRELGIAQGGTTSFGACLPTLPTAQQADTVVPIHLPNDEVMRPGVAKQLAFGIDTGSRVPVGALHASLLEHSWWLSQRLHPTRHPVSTPLR